MEVTRHIVQFDVDPGTFPLLDVGPAGCEQRFDIRPVDTGLGGSLEDHLQGLAVFLSHTQMVSYYDIIFKQRAIPVLCFGYSCWPNFTTLEFAKDNFKSFIK